MKDNSPLYIFSGWRVMTVYFYSIMGLMLFAVGSVHAQTGRVGINTATPAAALHVVDSNVVFSESNFSPNNALLTAVPINGAGARMMWHSMRRSFRAGAVTGNEWSADSLGAWSFATGINTTAYLNTSTAMGVNSKAINFHATALGNSTKATGINSTTMGYLTKATQSVSTAMGQGTLASAVRSTATGMNTTASGESSFAMGIQSISSGIASLSSGDNTKAKGNASATFGFQTIARPYASFVLGRYNDTTAISLNSWNAVDPLFIIGNGISDASRSNALTVLKNGNMGLFTRNPEYRLHVANDNFNDGGHLEGIMIENTNAVTPGEAALSFRNKSMPSNRQWMIGINETLPHLSFAYGTAFTLPNTHMVFDTVGRMGINTTSPQAMVHVVRNNPSGGSFNANSIAILESNNISYVQLSSENTDETGFLSGNQVTSIRSAIVFAADSSIDVRAGGNSTDIKISKTGNVGIGTYTPTHTLHVDGTVKLGTNGTTVTEVIKATVNVDLPSIAAGATLAQSYPVTNAALTSAVSVSSELQLNAGIVVASTRVSSAGNVEVRFVNTTAAPINVPAMDYHFTVIR